MDANSITTPPERPTTPALPAAEPLRLQPVYSALSALASAVRSGEEMTPMLTNMVDEARAILHRVSLERLAATGEAIRSLDTLRLPRDPTQVSEAEIEAAAIAIFKLTAVNGVEAWRAMIADARYSTTVRTFREFAREAVIAAAKVRAQGRG